MKKFLCSLIACLPLFCLAGQKIDDSQTVVEQAVVKVDWRELVPSGANKFAADGKLRVHLALNMTPWIGKNVRIGFRIGNLPPGTPVGVAWASHNGVLRNGRVRNDDTFIVYEGTIKEAMLRDMLDMVITVDGRYAPERYNLNFDYEVL